MARQLGRLKALTVSRATKPGLYADGGGLYLQVTGAKARSWTYRYMAAGKAREMGLGSARDVSLADARDLAAICRRQRAAGIDPIEARNTERARVATEAAGAVTFRHCAESYIEAHRAGWRSAKHAAQWPATLTTYAYPIFGGLPVAAINTALTMKAIEPIWSTRPETASRVRGRIESVLDWATARGYRAGENPARWRGHLENLLPKRAKVRRVRHHPALPYVEIGAFMRSLRALDGTASLAFQFLILTASRTSEAIGARWSEIDLAEAVWTVPADRIKAGKEHRVPLSTAALAIIKQMLPPQGKATGYVFPGGRAGRPLSNMALLALLKRMGRSDLTTHGFRSTFRDWAAESTNFPSHVVEMALAHAIGNKVEAAYRRGDLFQKRAQLMAAWGRYCAAGSRTTSGAVVSLVR